MKTLYISDLDGTLLRSDERTSEYTNSVINELKSKGMLFSYATARSSNTARKVTAGITVEIPIITYNGASIVESVSGKILCKTAFAPSEAKEILSAFLACGITPQVYSYINGAEKFLYLHDRLSPEHKSFISTRKGDPRDNPVQNEKELFSGEVFYFLAIDCPEILCEIKEKFREKYKCLYTENDYSGDMWLEIMPKGVSKANAALSLKELLGADKIVSFGNGMNDSELFKVSDECYAVENAENELKKLATGVIGSNDEDGVAKFLLEHFKEDK